MEMQGQFVQGHLQSSGLFILPRLGSLQSRGHRHSGGRSIVRGERCLGRLLDGFKHRQGNPSSVGEVRVMERTGRQERWTILILSTLDTGQILLAPFTPEQIPSALPVCLAD